MKEIGEKCSTFVNTQVVQNTDEGRGSNNGNNRVDKGMFSMKRLLEKQGTNMRPRNSNSNRKSRKCSPRCIKLSWKILSILVIALAVILALTPLVLSKVPPKGIPNQNNSLWEKATELALIRYYKQAELLEANCSLGFEFNGYFCLPPCNWHPAGPAAFTAQKAILNIIDLSGILLSIVSICAWVLPFILHLIKERPTSLEDLDLNLPRLSLFMLLLSVSILILLYTMLDVPDQKEIFCHTTTSELGIDFSLVSPHNNGLIEFYGALFHYFTLTYLLWTIFSWLNIILVLLFPLQICSNLKTKRYIFIFEFSISLLTPFIALILATNAPDYNGEYTTAYGPLQIYRILIIRDHNLYNVLYEWPHFACLSIILVFNVVIVLKLKLYLLRQEDLSGRTQKIGGFETRFMIHSIILIILNVLINTTVIAYRFVTYSYYWNLEEIIGCVTLDCNITYVIDGEVHRGKSLELINLFSEYYDEGDILPCQNYLQQNEDIYPSFLFIMSTISLRLIWVSVFVVLIPQFNPGGLFKTLKGYFKMRSAV